MSYYDNITKEYSEDAQNEIAILIEDINLTLFGKIVIGKFYVPLLFPLLAKSGPIEQYYAAPSTNQIINHTLTSKPYKETNFIRLAFPRYMIEPVIVYRGGIPWVLKDTKFNIGLTGGNTEYVSVTISGLYGHELYTKWYLHTSKYDDPASASNPMMKASVKNPNSIKEDDYGDEG